MINSEAYLNLSIEALNIFRPAVESVKPEALFRKQISLTENRLQVQDQIFDLSSVDKIYVIGAGKDRHIFPGLWKVVEKTQLNPFEFLANNNAYHFFEQINGLVKTGPTGTNVMDIGIALVNEWDT